MTQENWNNNTQDLDENYSVLGLGVGHRPVPSRPASARNKPIYWPIVAEITAVYHVDSVENRSAADKSMHGQVLSTSVVGEYVESLLPLKSHLGHRIECDVVAIKGIAAGTLFKRVPLCIPFGGIHNSSYVVPNARKNTHENNAHGDGDLCIINCIGGDQDNAVITGFLPHHFNTVDGPRTMSGQTAEFTFNGLNVLIDKRGSFKLDGSKSGTFRQLNPDSGFFLSDSSGADGNSGSLSFITKGDINIGSGFSEIYSEENFLPKGKMLIRSAKDLSISSQHGNIDISTIYRSRPVTLQGRHGNAKSAARKGDRVKIVSGAGGDLFSYLSQQRLMIRSLGVPLTSCVSLSNAAAADAVAANLKGTDDLRITALSVALADLAGTVSALAASLNIIIEGFTELRAPPESAVGSIIEGSSLVKIGGSRGDTKYSTLNLFTDNTLNFMSDVVGYDVPAKIGTSCTVEAVTKWQGQSLGLPDASGVAKALDDIAKEATKLAESAAKLPAALANLLTTENSILAKTKEIHTVKYLTPYPDTSVEVSATYWLTHQGELDHLLGLEAELSKLEKEKAEREAIVKELESAVESAEKAIKEAKEEVESLMGSSEVQMATKIAEVSFIAASGKPLLEKIDEIGDIAGDVYTAYVEKCLHEELDSVFKDKKFDDYKYQAQPVAGQKVRLGFDKNAKATMTDLETGEVFTFDLDTSWYGSNKKDITKKLKKEYPDMRDGEIENILSQLSPPKDASFTGLYLGDSGYPEAYISGHKIVSSWSDGQVGEVTLTDADTGEQIKWGSSSK